MKIHSENKKTNSQVKSLIRNVLLSSTSHGIPKIIGSQTSSLKILWFFCTIISAGLCCFLIAQNIISYFNYEVTTTFRFKNEISSLFPTITICNINFFTTEYAAKTLLSKIDSNASFNKSYFLWFNYYLSTIVYSDNDLQSNISSFSDSKEKLLVKSAFDFNEKNKSEFSFYFHPLYGNCYQFNSGNDEYGNKIPLKSVTKTEPITNLWLALNISIHNDFKNYNFNFGAIIFIHNHTSSPFSVNGITLGARTITNIEAHICTSASTSSLSPLLPP